MKIYPHLIFILFLFCSFNATASATTYYVDYSNGSDNNNGLSGGASGAWKTLDKVNRFNFNTGDDIYFKCGETWNLNTEAIENFTVDWNGTKDNYVIIGAYYMDGNTERIVDGLTHVCPGDKPTFDGDHSRPSNGPTANVGLINQRSSSACWSYIQFQDLRAEESRAEGFEFSGDDSESCSNIRGYRLETYRSFNSGMAIWGDLDAVTIEDCVLDQDVYYIFVSPGNGKAAAVQFKAQGTRGASTYPAASNILWQNNVLKGHYGECYNIQHNDSLIIQDSLHFDNMKNDCINLLGHYDSDGGSIIIRRNLFFQTEKARKWKEPQDGAVLTIQDSDDTYADKYPKGGDVFLGVEDVYFYNNLIAGYETGIEFARGAWLDEQYKDPVQIHDKIYIYNNTFVDTEGYTFDCGTPAYVDYGDDIYIRNNIFAKYDINDSNCTGNAIPHACCTGPKTGNCDEMWQAPSCDNDPDFDNVVFNYNSYSRVPMSEDIKGPDDYYGDPLLLKNSGWMSLTGGSLNGSDFDLQSGSPVRYSNEVIGAQVHYNKSKVLSPPKKLTVKLKK